MDDESLQHDPHPLRTTDIDGKWAERFIGSIQRDFFNDGEHIHRPPLRRSLGERDD